VSAEREREMDGGGGVELEDDLHAGVPTQQGFL
jgi:hypothetical protein